VRLSGLSSVTELRTPSSLGCPLSPLPSNPTLSSPPYSCRSASTEEREKDREKRKREAERQEEQEEATL